MSISAYVFVECTRGKPSQVADALLKIPGVEMAHAVTGAYDVIAFVTVESMGALADVLSRRIHGLAGVLKTTTNVVVEAGGAGTATRGDRGRRA